MRKSDKQLNSKTRSLGTKIFYLFTAFAIVIYVSLSVFFLNYQSELLKDHLLAEGGQLANLLAYNLKLGVFAENNDLLRGPVESIMEYDEAILVQVFTGEGRKLMSLTKTGANIKQMGISDTGKNNSIFDSIRNKHKPYHSSGMEWIEFWAPVTSGERFTEENLYYEDTVSPPKEYIIGFVRVVLTTSLLNASLNEVLIKSTLIPILFIIPGWLIAYYIVIRITRPLKRLTHGIKTIGTDGPFENIPLETNDEIGQLATAFNDMALSLKQRGAEKQELEDQLRQAQKMEAVGTLAGGIAHDFNNIISVIKGYGRMLQKNKGLEDSTKNYADQIVASSNRAAALTRRLLTFGRKQIINPEPVNVNDIILNLEPMLQRLITEDIQLSLKLFSTELIVVADTTHMEQVIMNLIVNARDAMLNGGSIIITTRRISPEGPVFRSANIDRNSQYAVISIEDTGSGINKEIKDKIFDPFFTTKDAGEGTGLGLSIVYGIIKQHNGVINADTMPGKGTTFNIFLPISKSIVEKRPKRVFTDPKGGPETILIAEDDPYLRELIASLLKQQGYNIIEAVDGDNAVEQFRKYSDSVALLLIDVVMPKKKGTEVYEEVSRVKPDIKTLFISGDSSDHLVHLINLTKDIDFLSKPILPDKLLHKVRELLDKKQL